MKFFYHSALISLLGVLFVMNSCLDIDAFKTDAEVTLFSVEQHLPNEIVLGDAMIGEDTIVIDLAYGKYLFPLRVKALIGVSDLSKLRNIDCDNIVFETAKSVVDFYIQTESGLPIKKYIALREIPRSNKTDILSFNIESYEPTNALVANEGYVYLQRETAEVCIPVPIGHFPLTIIPKIEVAAGAHILQSDEKKPLIFTDEFTTHTITVVASDGFEKKWLIRVVKGELIIGDGSDQGITQSMMNNITFAPQELKAHLSKDQQTINAITDIQTDANSGVITLTVKGNKDPASFIPTFPVKLSLDYETLDQRMTIGYKPGDEIIIENEADSYSFYLYDKVNNFKKRWTLKTRAWQNDANDVTGFIILASSPGEIMIENKVVINSESGLIVLKVSDGKSYFPLSVECKIATSPLCTLKGATPKHKFVFETTKTKKEFTVVAQNGDEKLWRVELEYAGELSSDANVENFRINEYTSTNDRVVVGKEVAIDKIKRTITLDIEDWKKYFPLKIKALATLSHNAVISQGAFDVNQWITFSNINSYYPFTVKAQDDTEIAWRIVLKDKEPYKSNNAELLSFTIAGMPDGYKALPLKINEVKKSIQIVLTEKGSDAFSFVPTFTVSPGSFTQGIVVGNRIYYSSFDDKKNFSILSQSEEVENWWNIEVSYQPQLTNGSLQLWNGNTPIGWMTANNTFTSGTTEFNYNGSKVARLLSAKVDMGIIKEMASASLFVGKFSFNINDKNNPKKMTNFGIPFVETPKAISFYAKYTPQPLIKVQSNSFVPTGGMDKASVGIKLIHWKGTSPYEFHDYKDANGNNTETNAVILAEGTMLLDAMDWQQKTLTFKQNSNPDGLKPTHISIVFASSYLGDEFICGPSSELLVNNVVLIY